MSTVKKPYLMVAPYAAAHLDREKGLDLIRKTPFAKTAWALSERLYVPLPREGGKNCFRLPDFIPPDTVRLHVAERYRKDGGATIICGYKGGKLRPYLRDCPILPNYLSCWFSVEQTAFTVTAWPEERKIRIKRRTLVIEGGTVTISDPPESRFECHFGDTLPNELKGFRDAIDAAIAKAEFPSHKMSYFFKPCEHERIVRTT